MLRIYCFHAAPDTAIGFQRKLWTWQNGNLAETDERDGGNLTWASVTQGGANALCALSAEGLLFLSFRSIIAKDQRNRTWHMNVALETDAESYDLWQKLSLRLLTEYGSAVAELANCFLTDEAGEYQLEEQAFREWTLSLTDANSAAQAFRKDAQGQGFPVDSRFEELLRHCSGMFSDWREGLFLLVPAVSERYFYLHTTLNNLPQSSAVTIPANTWTQMLTHTPPTAPSPETVHKPTTSVSSEPDEVFSWRVVAAGTVIAATFWGTVRFLKKRSSHKRSKSPALAKPSGQKENARRAPRKGKRSKKGRLQESDELNSRRRMF